MAGTGTGGTAGAAGTGTGGMGGSGGMMFTCPADPGITMCGTDTCAPVGAGLAMACYQVCCTSDMKCGTQNAALGSACMETMENTSMCPNETIMGNMVPGCCVDEATNECGIMNILGFGPPCVGRTDQLLQFIAPGLAPANCDGTPVMMGTGGMGGGDPDAGMTGGMGGGAADAGM